MTTSYGGCGDCWSQDRSQHAEAASHGSPPVASPVHSLLTSIYVITLRMLFAQQMWSCFAFAYNPQWLMFPQNKVQRDTYPHMAWSSLYCQPPALLTPHPPILLPGFTTLVLRTLKPPACHVCLQWSLDLFQTPSYPSNLIQVVLLSDDSSNATPSSRLPRLKSQVPWAQILAYLLMLGNVFNKSRFISSCVK